MMQESERDLLIKIDTKLDLYKHHLDLHVAEDNKKFDEVFKRLRTLDRFIGGLLVLEILLIALLKFWR